MALFMGSDRVSKHYVFVAVVSGENCSEGNIKGVYSPSSSVGRLYCKDLHNCRVVYVTGRVVIG